LPRWRHYLSRPVLAGLTLLLLGGAAVALRAVDLGGRDLWTDEAWVALAALNPAPGEALAAGQSTPPLYLLTIWAAAQILGGSEAVLRSLSFLFGLGTLAAGWLLARSLAPLPASLLALAALAFSPVMVYYSKELKQYSGDAFWAVLLFLLVERLRAAPRRPWVWAALGLAGLVGPGFSQTLIFILPVAALVLWCSLPSDLRPRVALLGGFWLLSFAAGYFLFIRRQLDPELVAYWTQDFPDFSGLAPFGLWLGSALYRYFWYFLGEWGVFWGPPLALAGVVWWRRHGQSRAVLYFLGPLLLAFAAACLHRYPFMAHYGGNRLMLFSAPLLYLTVTVGGCAAFAWLWRARQGWLGLILAGLLLVSLHPLENLRENLHPLANREEIQPLVAELARQVQPRDLVYVYYFAIPPFKYYYRGPAARLCWGKSCVETGLKTTPEAGPSPERLWLLASHIVDLAQMREFAAGLLGPHWQECACQTRVGAALLRFEKREQAVAANPPVLREPPDSATATPPTGTADK
jgi:4-amino-4-deoxy-L-arabinose transferase-like glycosyltransferase